MHQLAHAGQQAEGAHGHERDVQVWSIDVLPGWEVLVAACDLHFHRALNIACRNALEQPQAGSRASAQGTNYARREDSAKMS